MNDDPERRGDPAGRPLELAPELQALLDEARRLTGLGDDGAVLTLALSELVERQRFRRWVEAREAGERGGTA